MKKTTIFALAMMLAFCGFSQSRIILQKELRDRSSIKTAPIHETSNFSSKAFSPKENKLTANTIGTTWFDLQTNASMQSRMYLYPDGFIGGAFTFGTNYSSFPDRGTGYNSYDGTNWGAYPTQRIEDDRVGWPSYSPWGETGEIVVAHYSGTSIEGLVINRRPVKGTGNWTTNDFYGPLTSGGYIWPRSATGGTDHSDLHVIAITLPVANGGSKYQGMDGALLYSRSPDGGQTWDMENVLINEINSSYFTGFTGDTYEVIAQGDNVAILVGDDWTDLVLLKSTDNGLTWVKTIIWEHPYPLYDPNNPIVTDTFYCTDGSHSIAFDNTGKVHIAFGINRANYDGSGTWWFPSVGGIGYWNEDMATTFSNNLNALSPYGDPGSELIENLNLIGWSQDIDFNGTLDVIDDGGKYFLGFSSMPQLVIDEMNNIFLVYSSVTEYYDNGVQNYRHLWARGSNDNGQSWGGFIDLNVGLAMGECVFPSCSPTADDNIHLIYQRDNEPGMAVTGDQDPYAENLIEYLNIPKEDIVNNLQLGGYLSGIVTDVSTGLPVNGATITLIGTDFTTITGIDGTYEINYIVPGDYSAKCSAMGYLNNSTIVSIAEGIITTQGFQLEGATNLQAPTNLTGDVNDMNVILSWNDPQTDFSDDFESYDDFVLEFSPWTTIDVDGGTTYSYTGVDWPNASDPQAFIIFNPSTTIPPITDMTARSGDKIAACLASTTPDNDDWLISPQTLIESGDQLSFWVKSYVDTYGLERYNVGISTTGTDPGDFIIVSGSSYLEAPADDWEEYTYDLAGYVGQDIYVGIQCVSSDAFFFLVDDFSIGSTKANFAVNSNTPKIGSGTKDINPNAVPGKPYTVYGGSSGAKSVLEGYHVFRNENLIDFTTELAYTDSSLDPGLYEYFVTAVYDEGESAPSNTVALEVFDIHDFNLKLFLEGPYLANQMIPYLNLLGYIPLEQPYSAEPWSYGGNESVAAIPNADVVDWVMVELRKSSGDASTAIPDSTIDMEAGFLLKTGDIVGLDGVSPLQLRVLPSGDLYAVVWHRNHLGVISNFPLVETAGVYNYDFTIASNQAYGDSYVMKEVGAGTWSVMSGDGLNDTKINNEDKNEIWIPQEGSLGYHEGDYNMDGQVNDSDKEVSWESNSGKSGMVPGGPSIDWTFVCGDLLTDFRDGQSYTTIQIGVQCWMAENLNVGTMINSTNDQTNNGTIEKYCIENNSSKCDTYGGLYQWDEVMEYDNAEGIQGICPIGWHLPSDAEYCTLENAVDIGTVSCSTIGLRGIDAGGNLKETGTTHWSNPNTGATNSSGFTALPGAFRHTSGVFSAYGNAFFWSSSEHGSYAWIRNLSYNSPQVNRNVDNQAYGLSVRCLKD